jgi:hypothetical protein
VGTLHLPPGHVWRVTLMAALAVLLITLLLLIPAADLAPDGFPNGDDGGASGAQPTLSAPAGQGQWPEDPLALPTVELAPAR